MFSDFIFLVVALFYGAMDESVRSNMGQSCVFPNE